MDRSTSFLSFSRVWPVLLLVWVAGCSGGGPEPTFRVTGTVKFADGKPLAGGQILFRPVEGSKYSARADIGEDGAFTLGTFELADGAVAATHKVTITPAVSEALMEDPRARARQGPVIDPRYQASRTTPLEYVVSEDASENHFDIVVEPPKRKRS